MKDFQHGKLKERFISCKKGRNDIVRLQSSWRPARLLARASLEGRGFSGFFVVLAASLKTCSRVDLLSLGSA
jgi:hypothetical protein